ncbi:Auxin-induced protein 5NG4 [Dichanthelium oligosanthes]|uniref:Auxin-induced protein 5NG4 n=1 Tax=Dichanthelium oligosanthes TaxID=888268 RepID=A0A1E5VC07_9POAL|nr:Auxin-induced protein 5NG4 [Dichanthelium oligosanthes]
MAFLVYRNGSALVVVAPFAYFLENYIRSVLSIKRRCAKYYLSQSKNNLSRHVYVPLCRKDRPPLTLRLMAKFFTLAAVGLCRTTFTQGLYILGLYYLSPTYVSAIQNSVPAITFVMSAALRRIEQVNITSGHGLAKIAGTVATIAGATIITLYKGMPLTTNSESEGTYKMKDINVILSPGFTRIAGCLIMFVNCLCLSAWMVLQLVEDMFLEAKAELNVTECTIIPCMY